MSISSSSSSSSSSSEYEWLMHAMHLAHDALRQAVTATATPQRPTGHAKKGGGGQRTHLRPAKGGRGIFFGESDVHLPQR
jgi:hypothetical protein